MPEDARQAPVESVTLPQALNLDDFDLEEDDTLQGYEYSIFFLLEVDDLLRDINSLFFLFFREFDNHLRSQQDITLTGTYFACRLLMYHVMIRDGVYDDVAGFCRSDSYWH